ncbi:pyridoxal phosphate-dependent aminotransferase [Candidatus Desulfovibrio trichonymphae]|uniref:Aminotransferase n=1 Tax=Candidatus Desulfovibrio trichonymphae TaxID=1725232 RepID=A0A1J1DW14_9BACT|nr:pyridoxal phosphate-dependent aminotransferase [Candidatus Desulfovibrio trichonymphae]BAV92060.1 aspartate aminotransferase [Candidatus Desulfovibrio trichonymphae]GHU92754.1 aminotransferase [Deltaproteobacteria bacterium]GHU94547.1 aminotransferase [Deltaproteobacteria bacterium]GHU98547.1 aminotransferase [Deltaproteobacteria bacterium]
MQISERLRNVKPSLTLALNAKAMELKAQGIAVVSLAVGQPDFPTPAHICDATKAAIDANFSKYTPVPGIPELREAVGGYFKQQYDVPVPRESVILSAGGKQALFNFVQGTINPGDEVLVPAPCWLSYPPNVELAGGVPVLVHPGVEHAFKVTPEMLEAHRTPKTRLLILNSPNNPTGAVYAKAELDALVDWAVSHGLSVLSDEIYDQLVCDPAKPTSVIDWFVKFPEQVAVLGGLSKTFAMTGWRVGYLVAHPDLIKKFSTLQGQSTANVCSIAQKAALAALTGPMDCVETMRAAFQRRRDEAMKVIKSWPFVVCPQPDGAFYLFIDVRRCYNATVQNSTDICAYLLDKARVTLVPGVAFGDDNCIRLSYAVADEVLAEALDRIGAALAELVRQ